MGSLYRIETFRTHFKIRRETQKVIIFCQCPAMSDNGAKSADCYDYCTESQPGARGNHNGPRSPGYWTFGAVLGGGGWGEPLGGDQHTLLYGYTFLHMVSPVVRGSATNVNVCMHRGLSLSRGCLEWSRTFKRVPCILGYTIINRQVFGAEKSGWTYHSSSPILF
jgi:hypothetical protein